MIQEREARRKARKINDIEDSDDDMFNEQQKVCNDLKMLVL